MLNSPPLFSLPQSGRLQMITGENPKILHWRKAEAKFLLPKYDRPLPETGYVEVSILRRSCAKRDILKEISPKQLERLQRLLRLRKDLQTLKELKKNFRKEKILPS